MATLTVPIRMRIPFRTKLRMKAGLLLAWCGLESFMVRVVGRLAYDVKVGSQRWQRLYVDVEVDHGPHH